MPAEQNTSRTSFGDILGVAAPALGAVSNLVSMFSEARKEQQARR
jgi:hypothetical protein